MSAIDLTDVGPIVLLGAGKMGMALVRGWLDAGLKPENLVLVSPRPKPDLIEYAAQKGVQLMPAMDGTVPRVLVLAVKPQVLRTILGEIAPTIDSKTLVLSVAAGISMLALTEGLKTKRVIRTMPNTPSQVGKGVTGLVPADIDTADREIAQALFAASGAVVWLKNEAELDALTGVSGSGPAYVFHLVEALSEAARRHGLSDDVADLLGRQTVIGAAALMEADSASAEQLRINVTSPKGTTAAALAILMGEGGFVDLVDKAVAAARARSAEIGRE
ncbi:pyrroline-5-carboxylate reductase [Devosia rhodophyticola]|uniref:Pyrroline-5-carboxylate reductase n=1 Tax=Devosia rhodophyticola TaxID=3026423 RepID=A0ABY7YV72_9HYPH|nr:pyrroline-5-carboxylate reductase [Devosia rhodophyticola]WDR05082.1 pyrroline-5-carboxylate reductase [Devosia rhodophyticola]